MLRLLAFAVAFTLMIAAGAAQQSTGTVSDALIGLPVVTSDGRQIGRVTEVVREPGHESTLIAEIERPGGIGPRTVSIPADMFVQRATRIEISLTFEELNDRLEGPQEEP